MKKHRYVVEYADVFNDHYENIICDIEIVNHYIYWLMQQPNVTEIWAYDKVTGEEIPPL